MKKLPVMFILALGTTTVIADSSTLDAAIGGGLGGAAGAALGNELGGRDGAIIGGALGGAAGAAINTDPEPHRKAPPPAYRVAPPPAPRPYSRFCPPGQAKKGRC